MLKPLIICFLMFFNETSGLEIKRSAELFDYSGNKKTSYSSVRLTEGGEWSVTSEFKDLSGSLLVKETSSGNGGKLLKYSIERIQTKEKATIEVKDNRVVFRYFDRFNEKTEKKEKLDGKAPFIIGHMIPGLIEENWSKILNKEDIEVRYAVWYRSESLAFRFRFKDETKDNINVTMEPTSFVIRQLVDPIVFSFEKSSKKLMSIRGRTIPKIEIDGKLKDFDAITKYMP